MLYLNKNLFLKTGLLTILWSITNIDNIFPADVFYKNQEELRALRNKGNAYTFSRLGPVRAARSLAEYMKPAATDPLKTAQPYIDQGKKAASEQFTKFTDAAIRAEDYLNKIQNAKAALNEAQKSLGRELRQKIATTANPYIDQGKKAASKQFTKFTDTARPYINQVKKTTSPYLTRLQAPSIPQNIPHLTDTRTQQSAPSSWWESLRESIGSGLNSARSYFSSSTPTIATTSPNLLEGSDFINTDNINTDWKPLRESIRESIRSGRKSIRSGLSNARSYFSSSARTISPTTAITSYNMPEGSDFINTDNINTDNNDSPATQSTYKTPYDEYIKIGALTAAGFILARKLAASKLLNRMNKFDAKKLAREVAERSSFMNSERLNAIINKRIGDIKNHATFNYVLNTKNTKHLFYPTTSPQQKALLLNKIKKLQDLEIKFGRAKANLKDLPESRVGSSQKFITEMWANIEKQKQEIDKFLKNSPPKIYNLKYNRPKKEPMEFTVDEPTLEKHIVPPALGTYTVPSVLKPVTANPNPFLILPGSKPVKAPEIILPKSQLTTPSANPDLAIPMIDKPLISRKPAIHLGHSIKQITPGNTIPGARFGNKIANIRPPEYPLMVRPGDSLLTTSIPKPAPKKVIKLGSGDISGPTIHLGDSNPPLTKGQKAALTRAKNKAAREAEEASKKPKKAQGISKP